MTTPELLSFIKGELSKGSSNESIKSVLLGAGWNATDIAEGFAVLNVTPITPATPTPVIPVSNISPISSNFINPNLVHKPEINVVNSQPVVSNFAEPASVASHDVQPNIQQPVHKKSKVVPVIVLVLALLLVGGAGVFAYTTGYFESPNSVMSTAQKNVYLSKSVKFDSTFTIKYTPKDQPKDATSILGFDFSNIIIQLKGDVENVNLKDKGNLNLSLSLGGVQATVQTRLLDDILYFSLEKAPTFGMADLTKYQNKWFFIKTNDNQDTTLGMVPVVGSGKSAFEKITEEEQAELKAITENANFLKFIKKNGEDTLEGVASNRYLYELDRPGITDYLYKLKNFFDKLANRDTYFSTINPLDVDKELNKMKNFQGEVWIGKKDKFPRKTTVSFSTDVGTAPDISGTTDVNIFVLMSDWNMPVKVEVPEGAQDLKALFDMELGDARAKGKDAAIKANMSNSRASAELYYDVDYARGYKGFCSSSDGEFTSAVTILKNINENIESGKAVCKDSVKNYILYAPISTGEYWCVDSTGFNGAKIKTPIGMICN